MIDNYDSFTHNLYQALGGLGAEVIVVRNDAISLRGVQETLPTHIVLSPGPGHPTNPRDFGICGEVIQSLSTEIPILGVCLGHQGIATSFGAEVIPAPEIVHGKVDHVQHDGSGLFSGLPNPLPVMRYHSWIVDESTLPPELVVTSRNAAGLVMGIQHRKRPLVGVQFHPESIGTPDGVMLLQNFLQIKGA